MGNNSFIKINKKGFVALTAVLLISAVLLFIVSSLALQVIDDGQISTAHEQATRARALAFACAENVLNELTNDSSFSTDGSIDVTPDLDGDDCDFFVSDGVYPDDYPKTINVESFIGINNYTAKMEIVVSSTSPSIVIDSWDELAN